LTISLSIVRQPRSTFSGPCTDVMQLTKHPLTDAGLKKFPDEWEQVAKWGCFKQRICNNPGEIDSPGFFVFKFD
jgi:hypothetical protein